MKKHLFSSLLSSTLLVASLALPTQAATHTLNNYALLPESTAISIAEVENQVDSAVRATIIHEDGTVGELSTETTVEVISVSRSGTIYQATVRANNYETDKTPSVTTIFNKPVSGDLVITWASFSGSYKELLNISGQWNCDGATWSNMLVTGTVKSPLSGQVDSFNAKAPTMNVFFYNPTTLGVSAYGKSFEATSSARGTVLGLYADVKFEIST